ncbi:uncharacterized protein LOC117316643 isoform X2 [Pecten maximus]|uniref:uncharacterized protein LOC117316643 isoform X2 n=1 Tax=Pecten maximus TaxID=6579 RepID=UPI0014587EAE|nr:uncharacterized protein LOC117316643 isoform X2 [Pecten maximus]
MVYTYFVVFFLHHLDTFSWFMFTFLCAIFRCLVGLGFLSLVLLKICLQGRSTQRPESPSPDNTSELTWDTIDIGSVDSLHPSSLEEEIVHEPVARHVVYREDQEAIYMEEYW